MWLLTSVGVTAATKHIALKTFSTGEKAVLHVTENYALLLYAQAELRARKCRLSLDTNRSKNTFCLCRFQLPRVKLVLETQGQFDWASCPVKTCTLEISQSNSMRFTV